MTASRTDLAGTTMPLTPSTDRVVEHLVRRILGGERAVGLQRLPDATTASLLYQTSRALARQSRPAIQLAPAGDDAMHLHQAIAAAAEADPATPPATILHALPAGTVLLVPGADQLSGPAMAYLDLILQLTQFDAQPLAVVLIGNAVPWAGLLHPGLEVLSPAILAATPSEPPRAPIEDEQLDLENAAISDAEPLSLFSPRGVPRPRAASLQYRSITPARGESWLVAPVAVAAVFLATAGLLRLAFPNQPSVPATSVVAALSHPAAPAVLPPPAPADLAVAAPEAEADLAATDAAPPAPPPPLAADPPHAPGLIILATAGDTVPALYAKVYRGMTPPPYAEVAARNPAPLHPGTLVIFPEPPGGWPRR